MPELDLTLESTDIRDFPQWQRDGTVKQTKRHVFYLGKYGPFTEYFDVDGYSANVVTARIDEIRRQLRDMHR